MKNKLSYPAIWQKTCCALAACTALAGAALAEDNASDWSGKFTIGLESSNASADSRDINASLTLVHNQNFQASRPFRHTLIGSMDNAKTKLYGTTTRTQDKDTISYQLAYFIDEKSQIEGSLTYLHDYSLQIDKGGLASLKYVRHILASTAHQLNFGIGVSYLDLEGYTPPKVRQAGGQMSYNYNGQLTERFSLNHDGMLKVTADVRYASLNTGISYALTSNISLSLTHSLSSLSNDANNQVNERSNTTNLNIGVDF